MRPGQAVIYAVRHQRAVMFVGIDAGADGKKRFDVEAGPLALNRRLAASGVAAVVRNVG